MNPDLNRRDFLRAGGSALALAALGQTGGAAADNAPNVAKRKIKKAVMYATAGVKGSVLEKFTAIKEGGFEGVDPMSNRTQDEVARAWGATGLRAASPCCNTHWNKPV